MCTCSHTTVCALQNSAQYINTTSPHKHVQTLHTFLHSSVHPHTRMHISMHCVSQSLKVGSALSVGKIIMGQSEGGRDEPLNLWERENLPNKHSQSNKPDSCCLQLNKLSFYTSCLMGSKCSLFFVSLSRYCILCMCNR